MFISTTSELEDICDELLVKKPKFIAVDTEFIRNNIAYYPKLSLIQISFGEKHFIVDALAPEIDLSSIEKLMINKEIIKVFHSCKQDIESLLTKFKNVPFPIFDTQIASMFCNYYYDFIGYSKLVEQYIGITLDKIKAKNSDWLKRPLSKEQLDYAINDVIHLYDLYQILREKLEEKNRMNWFTEEMHLIGNIDRYTHNPQDAWKKMLFYYEENPVAIKVISEWRETLAQRYNVNRNKIINHALIDDLIKKKLDRVDEILDYLKENIKNLKDEDLLEFIEIFNKNEKIYSQDNSISLKNYDKSIFSMLSIILDSKCKKSDISQKLIASKEELMKSISGQTNNLFKGWRYNFFGKSVELFMNSGLKFEISAVKSMNGITGIQSREFT
ncbi:ribonuclease D [Wolbachia endosymbiont of Chironomus riparius]|uniref:ribonuclease D n=1 Tax=Wolbachia endosymbiont of Chironomus riparius TaxID=2883238 RepID=UPI00209D8BAB|nr:ribonuclease D [Wolbachia endosymbiont of Chironomus riparius]